MVLTTTLWITLGAIAAAWITREIKVSEFRQAWINELRKDIAEFTRKAQEWADLYVEQNEAETQPEKAAFRKMLRKLKHEAFEIHRRIQLRFKLDDEGANALLAQLLDLLDPSKFPPPQSANWNKLVDHAVSSSRILLKKEWEVTKNPLRKVVRSIAQFFGRSVP